MKRAWMFNQDPVGLLYWGFFDYLDIICIHRYSCCVPSLVKYCSYARNPLFIKFIWLIRYLTDTFIQSTWKTQCFRSMSLRSRLGGFLAQRCRGIYVWSLAVERITYHKEQHQQICWNKCTVGQYSSKLCFFLCFLFSIALSPSVSLFSLFLCLSFSVSCFWSYSILLTLHTSLHTNVIKSSSHSSKTYPRWLPIELCNHPCTSESRPH